MKQRRLSFFSFWSRFVLALSWWRYKGVCLPSSELWEPYVDYPREWHSWVEDHLFELNTGQMGLVLVVAPTEGAGACVRIHAYVNASLHRSGKYIHTDFIHTALRSTTMLTDYESKRGVYQFLSTTRFKRKKLFGTVIEPLVKFVRRLPLNRWQKVCSKAGSHKIYPKSTSLNKAYGIYWVPIS